LALSFAGPCGCHRQPARERVRNEPDWQCVQLWPAGQLVGLYGTGGGRRPALTLAVVFVFAYLPEAYLSIKNKK